MEHMIVGIHSMEAITKISEVTIKTMTGSTQEELVFPITGGLLPTTIGTLATPIQPTITPPR